MTTLFFIHGMWVASWVWEPFSRVFEEKGFCCVRATLRHHVDGPATPDRGLGTTSLLDYAADLQREIRALPDPPVVIGHSMGGLLAQILAARGLARAAVLLTPASPRGIVALRLSVMRAFASIMCRPGFWKRPMRPTFNEASYGIFNMVPAKQRRALFDRFCFESGRAAAEIGFSWLDPARASAVHALAVTCPMLIIGARHDRMTPASVVQKAARLYPTATYCSFPDHAHWLIGEPGNDEVAASILEWLCLKGFAP